MIQLTTNFTLQEFGLTTDADQDLIENAGKVAENLQKLRDLLKVPILVTSGYRTPARNAELDGAINSMHLDALAADIVVVTLDPLTVYNAIHYLIHSWEMQDGGIGLYQRWVHYDTRPDPARWVKL